MYSILVNLEKTKLLFLLFIHVIVIFNSSKIFPQIDSPNNDLIELKIPERADSAKKASELITILSNLNLVEREKIIVSEFTSGNVPSFSRKLTKVNFTKRFNAKNYKIEIFANCDYLALGSDEDYLYVPLTPSTAQYIADFTNCTLPTKSLVDNIYNNSDIKLYPQPIPPSDKMTTIPVFNDHTDSIKAQISKLDFDRVDDSLIGGHKKDIIISNKIYSNDRSFERVVIYGWHRSIGDPIQPVYNGHNSEYADYSHGVRLVYDKIIVNGDTTTVENILADPSLYGLLSDEGVISKPYYPESDIFTMLRLNQILKPTKIYLAQNYPNPFNPSTAINYELPKMSKISIKVYDINGEQVKELVNSQVEKGNHKIIWNSENDFGKKVSSGVYFYSLKTHNFLQTKKMIVLK